MSSLLHYWQSETSVIALLQLLQNSIRVQTLSPKPAAGQFQLEKKKKHSAQRKCHQQESKSGKVLTQVKQGVRSGGGSLNLFVDNYEYERARSNSMSKKRLVQGGPPKPKHIVEKI